MATFAETLRRLMKEKGITHKALSSTVGVHRTTITDYVNGRRLPPEETFHRIHQVLPNKELYDAYFAEARPKDRKNKPLISTDSDIYNYYIAKSENFDEINKTLDMIIEKYDQKQTTKPARPADEYSSIAHALEFIISYFKYTNIDKLAPTDYNNYVSLFTKYSRFL